MKYEIAQMLTQGGGTIVNTASATGLVGMPYASAYLPPLPDACSPVIFPALVSLYPRVSLLQSSGENSVVSHTTMSSRPRMIL